MTSKFDWQGRVGDVWAEEWQRTDRSFAGLSKSLNIAILDASPEAGPEVACAYDIGCGAGSTSIALAKARPDISVTGIDLSAALIDVARDRARGLANVDFRVSDARDLPPGSADLLVSRHGVMFFDDPDAGSAPCGAPRNPAARWFSPVSVPERTMPGRW